VPKHSIAVNAPALRPHEGAEAKTDVTVCGSRCDELNVPVVAHPSADYVSRR